MPISKASGQAVAPAAKGDLVVGSATNDAAVLGVGSANQVLTVDSSTTTGLKWATPATPTSGLTLISRTSFTSSSGVTIDNLFSDTYEHYIVNIKMIAITNNMIPRLRARYGSTTQTTNQYWSAAVIRDSGGVGNTGFDDGGAAQWRLENTLSTNEATTYTLNFWRGSGSGKLIFNGTIFSRSYAGGGAIAGWCNADQAWTGLYLYPDSDTITGTVTVYGMAKS